MTGLKSLPVMPALRALGIDTRALYQTLSKRSIVAAAKEQNLSSLVTSMREIVPDLADQYTYGIDAEEYKRYWEFKLRALHAFQVKSALDAMELIDRNDLVVVDIGDSSGNHGAYLRGLAPTGKISRVVSINMDPVAVQKIQDRGGEAHLVRAEELDLDEISPDFMMCFETLEHLTDPLRFLHRLATNRFGEHLVVSVPYRRTSRFGGKVLQRSADTMPKQMTPEELHILELCPADWSRLALLAGYRTVFARRYLQFPRFGIFRAMAPVWRHLDFEGFLCIYLQRDHSISDRYTGW